MKKILRFKYAAIRRYGAKRWAVASGYIEFNITYVVSCSQCEILPCHNGSYPFIVELSNGTKFLAYLKNTGTSALDEVLNEYGELYNMQAEPAAADFLKLNINRIS